MKLGFVQFEPIHYRDAFQIADEYGFDYVELQMAYVAAGTDQLGRTVLADRTDEITDLQATHGVDLSIHLPHSMDIGATSDRIRTASVAETRECLRTAATLDADRCVIHPTSSARTRVWTPTHIRDRIVESIVELDADAADLGIELCMENMYHSVFSIDAFDRFFDETDCSMTLDTGHARASGLTSAEIGAFVAANADRIGHVHANDNKSFVVPAGEAPADDHLPVGVGDIDFATALGPLPDSWGGTVSLEMHTASPEYLAVGKRHFLEMLEDANGGDSSAV